MVLFSLFVAFVQLQFEMMVCHCCHGMIPAQDYSKHADECSAVVRRWLLSCDSQRGAVTPAAQHDVARHHEECSWIQGSCTLLALFIRRLTSVCCCSLPSRPCVVT